MHTSKKGTEILQADTIVYFQIMCGKLGHNRHMSHSFRPYPNNLPCNFARKGKKLKKYNFQQEVTWRRRVVDSWSESDLTLTLNIEQPFIMPQFSLTELVRTLKCKSAPDLVKLEKLLECKSKWLQEQQDGLPYRYTSALLIPHPLQGRG